MQHPDAEFLLFEFYSHSLSTLLLSLLLLVIIIITRTQLQQI